MTVLAFGHDVGGERPSNSRPLPAGQRQTDRQPGPGRSIQKTSNRVLAGLWQHLDLTLSPSGRPSPNTIIRIIGGNFRLIDGLMSQSPACWTSTNSTQSPLKSSGQPARPSSSGPSSGPIPRPEHANRDHYGRADRTRGRQSVGALRPDRPSDLSPLHLRSGDADEPPQGAPGIPRDGAPQVQRGIQSEVRHAGRGPTDHITDGLSNLAGGDLRPW